jgi:DnaK suppressor protein
MRGVGNCWRFAISSSPMMRRPRKRAPRSRSIRKASAACRGSTPCRCRQWHWRRSGTGKPNGRIDAALMRIDSGDYGWCVRCGEIEAKRLDRAPATTMCLACAKEG